MGLAIVRELIWDQQKLPDVMLWISNMAAEGELTDDIFLLDRAQVTSAAVIGIAEIWDRARTGRAAAPRAAFDAFVLRHPQTV